MAFTPAPMGTPTGPVLFTRSGRHAAFTFSLFRCQSRCARALCVVCALARAQGSQKGEVGTVWCKIMELTGGTSRPLACTRECMCAFVENATAFADVRGVVPQPVPAGHPAAKWETPVQRV
eukprot:gene17145-biopygen6820